MDLWKLAREAMEDPSVDTLDKLAGVITSRGVPMTRRRLSERLSAEDSQAFAKLKETLRRRRQSTDAGLLQSVLQLARNDKEITSWDKLARKARECLGTNWDRSGVKARLAAIPGAVEELQELFRERRMYPEAQIREFLADVAPACRTWQDIRDAVEERFGVRPSVGRLREIAPDIAPLMEPHDHDVDGDADVRTRLRRRVDLLERRNRQLRAQLLDRQVATDALIDTLTARAVEIGLAQRIIVKPERSSAPDDAKKPMVVFMLVSDIQAGQWFGSHQVSGLTSYNWDIMVERMQRYTAAVVSFLEQEIWSVRPTPVVNIAFLGDIVQGEKPYPGFNIEVDRPAIEQTTEVAVAIAKYIIDPLVARPEINHVRAFCVPGNHGKIGRTTHILNNFDTLVYRFLRDAIYGETDVVEFHISPTPGLLVVLEELPGIKFLLTHGVEVGYSVWGVNMAGVHRMKAGWEDLLGTHIDYVFLGHLHQEFQVPRVRGWIVANGSFTGVDTFSHRNLRAALPVQQVVYIHPSWPYSLRQFHVTLGQLPVAEGTGVLTPTAPEFPRAGEDGRLVLNGGM